MVPVNVIVALVIVGLFCILMPAGLLILWHKKTKTPVVNALIGSCRNRYRNRASCKGRCRKELVTCFQKSINPNLSKLMTMFLLF